MTALAGVWRYDGRPDTGERCSRMLSSQEIYGPHDAAQWSEDGIALGRRLMRVLPEDNYDRQPLVGGGGRYVLVAQIRLDNRDDLIKTLRISPEKASQSSDAELLLAAIERWESACFEHIVGDYAFALWDRTRHRLVLARDPLGQRPLHYHRSNGFFAFASMPKGLHALPEIPYAPDEDGIAQFLALMPETGNRSFFQGIERVEPGHVVTVTQAGLDTRSHWQPKRETLRLPRPEDYCDGLRELLDQAVQSRLRGDGNVGAHLSGGLDSGAVAATAARLLATSNRRVIAFTAVPREGYDGPAPHNRIIDEGPYAAAVAAQHRNIDHVLIRGNGRSPLDNLDRNFFLLDRPVLNICNNVWTSSINDAARKLKLKVLLSGDVGNLGLSYAGMELLPELFRNGRWLSWWKEARGLVGPQGGMRLRGVLARTLGPWCPTGLWVWLNRSVGNIPFSVDYFTAINARRLADLRPHARRSGADFSDRPPSDGFDVRLRALRGVDPGNYNMGVLGGWQIDRRDPTADARLLAFCLAIPTEQFLSRGIQRALARRALADRLPQLILDENRRGVQAADWHEPLTKGRDRIAAELHRLDACPPAARALDMPRLHRLVENWPTGGWERDDVSIPYGLALLRAISIGHFLRRATGSNL
jgi:asparagine synthase (glutamine-hydrolysing)